MRVATVYLLLAVMAGNCQGECQTRFTSNYYKASNRALLYHVYETKTTSAAVICGRDCSMDPQCASFNYHKSNHYCEMNNISKSMNTSIFVELQGSSYFDDKYETSFLSLPDAVKYQSCQMLLQAGHHDNGIYTIYPLGKSYGITVFCDMTDGGWIVFQRRQDGSVDFNRDLDDYQSGFGNLFGEFWLGNEQIKNITDNGKWKLHVDMGDWEGNTAWAEYDDFKIVGEKYTLNIGLYNADSTGGDSMKKHDTCKFSTMDKDNDAYSGNCARDREGGWWFHACFESQLNGKYYNHRNEGSGQGVQWLSWKGGEYSLKECRMKISEVL